MVQLTQALPNKTLLPIPKQKSSDPGSRTQSVRRKRYVPENKQQLGHYACRAIKKSLKKMVRHETDVLKDVDIEALHQMRIGLRRLRTTIQTFEQVLDLPNMVRDATLKPLTKRLGRVRDLDVLLVSLRDRHRPLLPKQERKALNQILNQLQKQRDRRFKRMKQFLHSAQYKNIKSTVRDWIQAPYSNDAAYLPIDLALPDLLLPVLSQTLLHPGWLATPDLTHPAIGPGEQPGTRGNEDQRAIADLNGWLDHQGLILHDLRKQMKHLRYQADFFAPQYDAAYGEHIKEFKTIQDVLGTLQDAWVLDQTLTALVDPSWPHTLPTMQQQLHNDRWQTWQQWEVIRQRYGTAIVRSNLRQMILTPQGQEKL